MIASNDCGSERITNEDRYRYFDDIHILEFILLAEKLIQYDFTNHVASDISESNMFLPTESTKMQGHLNKLSEWTKDNLMILNEEKSNYLIFSRTKTKFSTRLQLNDQPLNRLSTTKILGIWLQEDLGWTENTKQICIKAYSRVSVISKLKYAGIITEDLLIIYTLFIRSITEYCSVAFHNSLTEDQSHKIETIQSTCLKIILSDNYVSYSAALEMCNLDRLETRREKRLLSFSLRCLKIDFNKHMFQKNLMTRIKIHS